MKRCRICLGGTEPVLQLSPTPIANNFATAPDIYAPKFPLGLVQCQGCGHLQISHEIPGVDLFSDYKYQTPQVERTRLSKYAQDLAKQFSGKALEIGCNNGIFVEELNRVGIETIGIDPASPRNGLPRWFNNKSAKVLKETFGEMDLILANNVFAHVDSLRQTFMAMTMLLSEKGSIVFEVQYAPDMVRGGMFDMIYHEHKDYHTLKPLQRLFEKFDLCAYKVEHLPTHGGSIRVYVKRGNHGIPLDDPPIDFAAFKARIDAEGVRLREEIAKVKGPIVAFGATAKTCTLLHHLKLTKDIAYCVDETPVKQGRFIPGTAIKICPFDSLKTVPPSAILLTAWNYADVLRPRFNVPLIVPFEIQERAAA